jgi:hypothetical protein
MRSSSPVQLDGIDYLRLKIQEFIMPYPTEFKANLTKHMVAFIGLFVLNGSATIAIEIYRFLHMQPYWDSNMIVWNLCINNALLIGWFSYIQIRRSNASRQQ